MLVKVNCRFFSKKFCGILVFIGNINFVVFFVVFFIILRINLLIYLKR